MEMGDIQMFWSKCAESVEFLSQRRIGAALMESRHGEGQRGKQGLYQRKRSDFPLKNKILFSAGAIRARPALTRFSPLLETLSRCEHVLHDTTDPVRLALPPGCVPQRPASRQYNEYLRSGHTLPCVQALEV